MKRLIFGTWFGLLAAGFVGAADVDYVGSETSGDITVPEHWFGGVLPGATDKGVFPVTLQMPATGLTLGSDFAIKDLRFDYTNKTKAVTLDLNGKTIVMPEISNRGTTSGAAASENELYVNGVDAAHTDLTIQNGVVTNLVKMHLHTFGALTLKDVAVYMQRPTIEFNWYGVFTVGPGAVLYGDYPSGDMTFPSFGGNDSSLKHPSTVCIDGGRVVAKTDSGSWRRGGMQGGQNKLFEVKNGGRYDDISSTGNFYLNVSGNVLIHDGGVFAMTNSLQGAESQNRGFSHAGSNNRVVVSNATLCASVYNMLGKTPATNLFYDAVADFRYFGAPVSSAVTNQSGYVFRSAMSRHTILDGAQNDFRARRVRTDGATTNCCFEMRNGTAEIGNVIAAGVSNRLSFAGTKIDVSERVYFDGAHGSTIEFGDIDATVAGNLEFWGGENELHLTGTRGSLGRIYFHGAHDLVYQDGGAVTGGVWFGTSGNTMVLTNRAYRYVKYRTVGLEFLSGTADNTLVIDDSTFEQEGCFAGNYTSTGSFLTDCGNIYTNCPGCAVEFRGANPKLVFSGSKAADWGGWWSTAVFGSFGLNATVGTEPLPDPLAFRFVLPADGYREAPIQNVNPTADRPFVPGGNMRIEVDASRFVQTEENRRVPLVRDQSNFSCYSSFMLDIESLNRNNRQCLPEGASLRYVRETDASGKTVAGRIDLVFHRGMMILVR